MPERSFLSISRSRRQEQFREELYHDFDKHDLRIMPAAMLERWVDPQVANKFRLDIYKQQRKGIQKMTATTGSADEMEKYRATKGDYSMDAREFALEDNVAVMYFNYYGENFEGGEIIDNSDDGWTCPGCHIKYGMSLKMMPDRCIRCGWLSPLGRMKKDGVFNR